MAPFFIVCRKIHNRKLVVDKKNPPLPPIQKAATSFKYWLSFRRVRWLFFFETFYSFRSIMIVLFLTFLIHFFVGHQRHAHQRMTKRKRRRSLALMTMNKKTPKTTSKVRQKKMLAFIPAISLDTWFIFSTVIQICKILFLKSLLLTSKYITTFNFMHFALNCLGHKVDLTFIVNAFQFAVE